MTLEIPWFTQSDLNCTSFCKSTLEHFFFTHELLTTNFDLRPKGPLCQIRPSLQLPRILHEQGSIICHKSGHNSASYSPLVFFFFTSHLGYVLDLPGGLLFIFCQENAAGGKIYIPPKIGCMKYISLKPILTHLLGGAVWPRWVLQRASECWGVSHHT